MNKNKLMACLQALGIEPKMKQFNDRKKMQKITYFLPLFGIDVGLDVNSYNWYLHGPYSPEVTHTLFDIVKNPDNVQLSKLTTIEKEKIDPRDLIIPEIPYISSTGSRRPLLAKFKDLNFKPINDELNENKNALILKFELEKGCYATSLLREFMKTNDIKNY